MQTKPISTEDILWKQRFKAPSISQFCLAKAAPWKGTVISNQSGEKMIYHWNILTSEMTPIIRPPGIEYYVISPDGKYIYFMQDDHGNDLGHFVRVPIEGGIPEDITPGMMPYISYSIVISGSGGAIGFTASDKEGFHAWVLDIKPDNQLGQPHQVYESKNMTTPPWLSYDGELAFLMTNKSLEGPHFGVIAIDLNKREQIGELWDGPGINHLGYGGIIPSPVSEGCWVLISTDRSGFPRPLLWNPCTGQRVDLDFPEIPGELAAVDWSLDGKQILIRGRYRARSSLFVYDIENQKLRQLSHPGGTLSNLQFGPENQIIALWTDATHPNRVVELDGDTGTLKTLLSAGDDPPGRPWLSIELPSTDGEIVQGWLALPEGIGPFPTILDAGYIWGVQEEQFHPQSQAWLDHGFAFFHLNHRGARSFGRQFTDKILGNPGYWELEDLNATHEWLVNQNISDPTRMILTGWSYGGYLTLLALGRQPDLWAGGMAGTPVIDWRLAYEDGTPASRSLALSFFGGTPEEKPEQFIISSPMTYADKIQAPVMIIAGRNDTHSTTRQVTVFEEKIKSLGKTIQVAWYEGGHEGPVSQTNEEILFQEMMLQFAQGL